MCCWMSICAFVLGACARRWGLESIIFKAVWRFDVVRAVAFFFLLFLLRALLGGSFGLSGALLVLSWGSLGALWGSRGSLGLSGALLGLLKVASSYF